jgi:integrase
MGQYKRKVKGGVRWWYKFSFHGELYHSKAIYLTKNKAMRAEIDYIRQLEEKEQNPAQKPEISLLQAIEERLEYVEGRKTVKYFKENKKHYTILLKYFGDVPITTIKKADINKFLLEKAKEAKQQGDDNYAVNYTLVLYTALFNHIIEQHELDYRNPCKGIKPFPVTKKIKYIPSDKDVEAIRSLCTEQQKLLFDFVAETGARINEPLKVTGKDILDEYVVLYTRKSKHSNVVPRLVPKPDCIRNINLKPMKSYLEIG